jgi:hypothetical protein
MSSFIDILNPLYVNTNASLNMNTSILKSYSNSNSKSYVFKSPNVLQIQQGLDQQQNEKEKENMRAILEWSSPVTNGYVKGKQNFVQTAPYGVANTQSISIDAILKSTGTSPTKKYTLPGLFQNTEYIIAVLDAVKIENTPEFVSQPQNPGFIYFLERIRAFATRIPEKSPCAFLKRQLSANSANACYTFLKVSNAEKKKEKSKIQEQEYFLKVQVNPNADNLAIDNVMGYVLTFLQNANCFSKFVDCFISCVDQASTEYFIKPYIMPHPQCNFCRVHVQESLKDYTSVSDFLQKTTDETQISPFLKAFNTFCVEMFVSSTITGFVHNDAHTGNLFYRSNPAHFVMIDFGRVKFFENFWVKVEEQHKDALIVICNKSLTKYETLLQVLRNPPNTFVDPEACSFYFDIATMAMCMLRDSEVIRQRVENAIKVANKPTLLPAQLFNFTNKQRVIVPARHLLNKALIDHTARTDDNELEFIVVGLVWFVHVATMLRLRKGDVVYSFYEDNNPTPTHTPTPPTHTLYMDLLYRCNFIYYSFQFLDIKFPRDAELLTYLDKVFNPPTAGGKKRGGDATTIGAPGKTFSAAQARRIELLSARPVMSVMSQNLSKPATSRLPTTLAQLSRVSVPKNLRNIAERLSSPSIVLPNDKKMNNSRKVNTQVKNFKSYYDNMQKPNFDYFQTPIAPPDGYGEWVRSNKNEEICDMLNIPVEKLVKDDTVVQDKDVLNPAEKYKGDPEAIKKFLSKTQTPHP